MAVNFFLDSRENKQKENPIRVQVSIKGVVLISTIGFSVNKEVWAAGKISKMKYSNSKGVSAAFLNATLTRISSHFAQWDLELDHRPEIAEIKQQLILALHKEDHEEALISSTPNKKSFFDYFDEFVKEESSVSQWVYNTYKCWKTTRNHLMEFNEKVSFAFFNEDGLKQYISFLRLKKGLEDRSVRKLFSNLKWFLGWAIRKGYTKEDTVLRYRPKFKVLDQPIIFLTKEELLRLYNLDIPINGTEMVLYDMNGQSYTKKIQEAGALNKTRDLFCFCAFTSLRYSDMAKVKRSDIQDGILSVTTQKTNDRLPINLNKYSTAILEKYKNRSFPGDRALPVISNQKMNEYLKDLCEICGFNEPITKVCYRAGKKVEETFPKWELIGTHAGRRTFICFALSSGIPPQVVMKWTGHSNYSAMKPYIDIAESCKVDAMKLFESQLDK